MATDKELMQGDIEAYLEKYQDKELLRFVAVGSVDDGKSTLIGRMLHDTGMVYEDQLKAVKGASSMEGDEIDFSLFTDGLKAEREQGITIDVAYRYFNTDARKFIIADTPGHIQYTRNMVTGASTADVAIILIDARLGVLQQSRRHAYIADLLGIPHLAVCVNKMDLVSYDEQVFERIAKDFDEFAKGLSFKDVTFFPVSALKGVNIVTASDETPWYKGPNVLQYLETVPIDSDRNLSDFRFPVQYVIRPNLDYRGFAGEISSGVIRKGCEVMELPSGKRSKVKAIDTYDGEIEEAYSPMSVTIRLEDEIDVSRGDMLVLPDNLPEVHREVEANLVWMHETPLDQAKTYLIKHTTQNVRCEVASIEALMDLDTMREVPSDSFELNDIGRVTLNCHRALYYDGYKKNRSTGAFILVDSLTNNTVAAGMIIGHEGEGQNLDEMLKELHAGSGLTPRTQVSPKERHERMGQGGATVWLSGLPGSGRWSLAYALERRLFDTGRTATVADPTDNDLASTIASMKALTDAGLIAICAFHSPSYENRDALKARIAEEDLLEVYVNTDPALCKERRPEADHSAFQAPRHPDLTVALDAVRIDEAVDQIISLLEQRGQFEIKA